jgi:hypothetical protein
VFMHFSLVNDYDTNHRSLQLTRKLVVIFLCFLLLIKTFFFMRLFRSMAHLVSMMQQVFLDLQAMITFFFILIAITSLIFSTLELGNYEMSSDPLLRQKVNPALNYPGKEYVHLPKYLKTPIAAFRIALADFDYSESIDLLPFENFLYWVTWLIIVIITCIVFVNFIIAEVSNSY